MNEEENCLRQGAKEGLNTRDLLKRASIQLKKQCTSSVASKESPRDATWCTGLRVVGRATVLSRWVEAGLRKLEYEANSTADIVRHCVQVEYLACGSMRARICSHRDMEGRGGQMEDRGTDIARKRSEGLAVDECGVYLAKHPKPS